MSRKPPSDSRPCARAVLRGTVSALCVASVVMAPAVSAAPAAETSLSAQSAFEVRIGANSDFTRVEFRGAQGARAPIRVSGQTVTVRLPKGAESELARLKVDPPSGVASIVTRPAGGGTEVVITLVAGARAVSGRADGAAYLNLYPVPAAGPVVEASAADPAKPSPVPDSGVVKVEASTVGEALTLRFPWKAPLGAAVVRRGEAVWVVFDARARLDMSQAPKSLGAVKRVRWTAAPNATVVRIEAPGDLGVSASAEGPIWTVRVGGTVAAPQGNSVRVTRDDQTGPPALTAALAGATSVVWLTDPAVGDKFAVVTALGPVKALDRGRTFVQTSLLPTAQGLAIEASAGDLRVAVEGDIVRISRPGGLSLSRELAAASTAVEQVLPRPAALPALIEPADWGRTGEGGYLARYRQLQDLAAAEGARGAEGPTAARMGLARFLVGTSLNYEAIGLLDMLAKDRPAVLSDSEFRGLRGAAKVMVGRYKEAQADFSVPSLVGDASASLWRGYIDAKLGQWAEARRGFTAGARAIDLFPVDWKVRFATAHAEAAMELKDLPASRSLLAFALAQQGISRDVQLGAMLIQAHVMEADGQPDRALPVYDQIAASPFEGLATPALLRATKIRYDKAMITPLQAVQQLDSLKYRWRGDATELEVIRTLGEIYVSQGRYREALETLRSAGSRLPDLPEAVQLQADLAAAFRSLFLEDQADGLQPIEALGLFYDFKSLTPVGVDGDEMVRRLSRRLVDVDLLGQAAALLKYQVDNRLDGVAKSAVATDLAAVYLMDHRPEQALQAIWSSRTTLLPNALNTQRRLLEARALADLGRFDNALEVLGKDQGVEASDIRADVLWRQKDYAAAAALYEKRLGDRWKTAATPLSGEEETRLIRAGVALSLVGDDKGLRRLGEHWSGFIEQARAPDALRIALAGLDGAGLTPADFARASAQADSFASWVAAMKKRFRETGGRAVQSAAAAAATPAAKAR